MGTVASSSTGLQSDFGTSSNCSSSRATKDSADSGFASHDILFQQHLSGSATTSFGEEALGQDGDAFVSVLMSVLRRSIHESADFTICSKAVYDTLLGMLDEA